MRHVVLVLMAVALVVLAVIPAMPVHAGSYGRSGSGDATIVVYVSGRWSNIVFRDSHSGGDADAFVFFSNNPYFNEASASKSWHWLYTHCSMSLWADTGTEITGRMWGRTGFIKIVVKMYRGYTSWYLRVDSDGSVVTTTPRSSTTTTITTTTWTTTVTTTITTTVTGTVTSTITTTMTVISPVTTKLVITVPAERMLVTNVPLSMIESSRTSTFIAVVIVLVVAALVVALAKR